MSPATQIILSGTLTFGVPLALAVRDLIVTRRSSGGGGGWGGEPPGPVVPGPAGGGGGLVSRPLPQCLIDAAAIRPGKVARQLDTVH